MDVKLDEDSIGSSIMDWLAMRRKMKAMDMARLHEAALKMGE